MLKYGIQVAPSSALDSSGGISLLSDPSRLYYVNGSIHSWRVMMALYEKEIRFRPTRLLAVNHPQEMRFPDFLTPNRRDKAPVFVDNTLPSDSLAHIDLDVQPQIVVNESIAILHYLEMYHNASKPLLPPISQRTHRALSLSRIQESETLRHLYDLLEDLHNDAEKCGTNLHEEKRNQLIKGIDVELDFWEAYAEKTPFIAGNQFGLVDCAFFPLLACMVHRGFEWRRIGIGLSSDLEGSHDWPHLQAYFRRVWEHGGENGCAQMAQPIGWERQGKTNIWKGTTGSTKGHSFQNNS
ncbi:hypothetical protein BDZ94DRAFT_1157690 [Collybia nuda]|uniref:Glutathione S-transferase n=1 Tax=Collybia nuda TaxID=64659 RepID=A0A9P6CHM1_9AGAR|nr:hypothetical protein BDZ94DRAFT_1157690 [Collybia nuda]